MVKGTRKVRLQRNLLITSIAELKRLIKEGKTDEEILDIERERTVNYQRYKIEDEPKVVVSYNKKKPKNIIKF